MYIDGLHPDNMYKLRVFGYSRGGDGTMSSPAVVFMLGKVQDDVMTAYLYYRPFARRTHRRTYLTKVQ